MSEAEEKPTGENSQEKAPAESAAPVAEQATLPETPEAPNPTEASIEIPAKEIPAAPAAEKPVDKPVDKPADKPAPPADKPGTVRITPQSPLMQSIQVPEILAI